MGTWSSNCPSLVWSACQQHRKRRGSGVWPHPITTVFDYSLKPLAFISTIRAWQTKLGTASLTSFGFFHMWAELKQTQHLKCLESCVSFKCFQNQKHKRQSVKNALTMCFKRSCKRQRKTNNRSHKQQIITFNSPCSLWLSWVGSWRCPPVETESSGGCGAPWTQCNVCIHSTHCPGYGCRPEDKKDTYSSSSSSS